MHDAVAALMPTDGGHDLLARGDRKNGSRSAPAMWIWDVLRNSSDLIDEFGDDDPLTLVFGPLVVRYPAPAYAFAANGSPAERPTLRIGMAAIENVSKAEAIKQQSRQLRGISPRDLADTATPFDKVGYCLLKFHGIYQGYDRDSATERKQRGDDKLWQFMVRVRIPGGRLTADQYLALDGLADRYANGSLRVTTRQSIQFHGVVKPGLKSTIAEINAALLTTLAACGDVVRTVTTMPAPICDAVHDRLEADDAPALEPSAAEDPRLSRDLGRRRPLGAERGAGERGTERGRLRRPGPALRRALSAAEIQDRPRDPRGQHDRRVDQRPRDRRAVRRRAARPATISCSAAGTA